MKKHLPPVAPYAIKKLGLLFCLLIAKFSFSQSDGDYRTKSNNAGFGNAGTFEVYSAATGAWTTATVVPGATNNVTIRDGVTQTSNVSGAAVLNLTIGEGNAAVLTSTINAAGEVTGINIVNPGKLSFLSSGVTIVGQATTSATAAIATTFVSGASLTNPGSGYTTATVAFTPAPSGGTTATGTAVIDGGKITGITVTNPGSGYNTTVPAITITGDGTGAVFTSLMGLQSISITTPGSGYTAAPQVYVGTIFFVGNATTARTLTVNGDMTFRAGATILQGAGSTSITQTLNIVGNLNIATPVSFITSTTASTTATTSSTTVNFMPTAASSTITGPGSAAFRALSIAAGKTLVVSNTVNLAAATPVTINTTGVVDATNGSIGFVTYQGGAVAQTVANNTFLNGAVRDVTVNNTAGVTLNQNLTVSNQLSVLNGLLNIPATPVTLTISSANNVAGPFTGTNYINTASDVATGLIGIVQITNIPANAIRTLPLGNSGNYLPVTLKPSTISSFSTSVFTPATDNGTPNGMATTNNNIVNAVYVVNRTSGTGAAQLSVGFPAGLKGSGLTGIQNNQLGISRYNGTTWDPSTGSGDNTLNTATATFTTFSPFRAQFNSTPLPIKLSDITGSKVNDRAVLTWKVSTEVNASKYVVEKSVNGVFSPIGSVSATGLSSYSFTDNTPSIGSNLYRLKLVDKDNAFSYSKIVLVDFSKLTASVSISPNPISNGYFTVKFNEMKAGKVTVKMYSSIGQLVLLQTIDYTGSRDRQLINLASNITKGNYQLLITDGNNSQKASVIVQ